MSPDRLGSFPGGMEGLPEEGVNLTKGRTVSYSPEASQNLSGRRKPGSVILPLLHTNVHSRLSGEYALPTFFCNTGIPRSIRNLKHAVFPQSWRVLSFGTRPSQKWSQKWLRQLASARLLQGIFPIPSLGLSTLCFPSLNSFPWAVRSWSGCPLL